MALGTPTDLGTAFANSGTGNITISSVNIPTADVAWCFVGSRNNDINNGVSGSTVTWTEIFNSAGDGNHLQIFVAQGINATEDVTITRTGPTTVAIVGVPNASTTLAQEKNTTFTGGTNRSVTLDSASASTSTVLAVMFGTSTTAQTPDETSIQDVASASSRETTQFFEGVISTMGWVNSGVDAILWAGEVVEAVAAGEPLSSFYSQPQTIIKSRSR